MNQVQQFSPLETIISELYQQREITKEQFDQCFLNLRNNIKGTLINNSNANPSTKDLLSIFIKASYNTMPNLLSEDNIKQQKIDSFKSLEDSEHKLTTIDKIAGTEKTIDSATILLENFSHQSLDKINIEDFETNLLDLEKSLYVPFVYKVFNNTPYFSQLDANTQKLTNFLIELEKKYEKHNNPYHNYIHGLTVMHSCYILGKMKQAQKILSNLDYFALVFSGLCHDVGHTGFNNDFQIKTLSKKALRWNNKSVLENYHAFTTFKLLLKPKNNFLKDLSKDEFALLRKRTIDNILATDMKDHNSSLIAFESKINTPDFQVKNQSNISILSGFIIHLSDLSSSVKKFQVSSLWQVKINQQFSNQYRQQQHRGVSLSSFMKDVDINHNQATKNQISFCNNFVKPLYKCLNDFENSQTTKKMIENLEESVVIYQRQIEEQENKN